MVQAGGWSSQGARQRRLRELMDRLGLEALLLRRSVNFAWYTGGADNRVDHASPFGVADVLVTSDSGYVFTDNIEAPRMREEQTPNFEVIEHPWYEDESRAVQDVVGDVSLGTDSPWRVHRMSQRRSHPCATSSNPTPWGATGALGPMPRWRSRKRQIP